MAPPYQWITYANARTALAARLSDTANVFWVDAELKIYLIEALRTWNAFTEVWNANFPFTATFSATWYNLATLPNSPRIRTVTDSDIFTAMEYHLLETPVGGGTWAGTQQFTLADLQGALQRRRDEVIQISGCRVTQLPALPSTPNTRRVIFSDSTLEPRRVRFVPATGFGDPVTLSREDTLAFNAFESQHLQQNKLPEAWSMVSEPPLAMDVDTAPPVAGTYDVIGLQSGLVFAPPAATLLGVPNDWSWVCKWGALADLLGKDSEASDPLRAEYCLKRYTEGLQLMQQSNWLLQATIGGVPVDTPALREMDGFSPEWELNGTAWPSLVSAGVDYVAPCPVAGASPTGVTVLVVGNAPIPILDSDFVQVSRDVFDAILDYAETLALFKIGGAEFVDAQELESRFMLAAQATNTRLAKSGIFSDTLQSEGKRQERAQPRFGGGQ